MTRPAAVLFGLLAAVACLAAAATSVRAGDLPAPGGTFRDCAGCPQMVVVPAGRFTMGADDRQKQARPAHGVTIARAFAIGTQEVTFAEWDACIVAAGCKENPDDHGWGRGRRPVVNLTYEQIGTYLHWLSRHSGHAYRLPSEAEWEYAARGGTVTRYWWGDEVGRNHANCRNCGSPWSGSGTAPVGSFPANPFGLFDTSGNVWEWVADCWVPSYDGAPTDGTARRDGDCGRRVMRGGSWYYFPKLSESTYRFFNDVRINSYNIGFRVARDLP